MDKEIKEMGKDNYGAIAGALEKAQCLRIVGDAGSVNVTFQKERKTDREIRIRYLSLGQLRELQNHPMGAVSVT